MQQLDLFQQIDEHIDKRRKNEMFEAAKKRYEEWLQLPEQTIIPEDSPLRLQTGPMLWAGRYDLYKHSLHKCSGMPDNVYIWQNPCEREYWVLNRRGSIAGEHVEACPFCGAQLAEGKGDVVLIRADADRHIWYIKELKKRGGE